MPTLVNSDIEATLEEVMVPTFVGYAQIDTLVDDSAKKEKGAAPSSDRQFDLIRRAANDLYELGLKVTVDKNGYVYGFLKGNASGDPITLIAHVDTTDAVPVLGVKPRVFTYDGGEIRFPDDPELVLSPKDSPNLKKYIGSRVITASGLTLLGADDKAGMAEIYSCLVAWIRHPELPRPDVYVCFTHDEEIGHGIDEIDLSKLSTHCYTLDGGEPGSIDVETWNAFKMTVSFKGVAAHAGAAKGKMVNSVFAFAEFVQRLEQELPRPELTEGRDGFVHIDAYRGNVEDCSVDIIVRDFQESTNKARINQIEQIISEINQKYPLVGIKSEVEFQYPNMKQFIDAKPEVFDRAIEAIKASGLNPIVTPIRGGTDGSRLSILGHPCPNLGTGMEEIHSRREWVAETAMIQSSGVVLNLANEYVKAG